VGCSEGAEADRNDGGSGAVGDEGLRRRNKTTRRTAASTALRNELGTGMVWEM